MKKELQKKLSFVLFVMAVFFAGMSLTVFQQYIWMACIAGVLLLATSVFYVLSQKEDAPSPTEKTTDLLLADRMAELMRGNEKAEKGVYIAVKKQHEAMESGMAALREQIAELVKAQENAVKTLVMYNKENAKQMALSEREELGRLRDELKLLQQEGGAMSPVVDAIREMSSRLYEEMHENNEAILAELGTTVDSLEEIKAGIGNIDTGVPVAYDRDPVPMPEALEEEPADIFADSGVDLSDPNKTLSADDIAALFAQANATEEETVEISEPEPVEEEPVIEEPAAPAVEEKPEDAFASSGVDLSDPNKSLSADDIAALFAAMGN